MIAYTGKDERDGCCGRGRIPHDDLFGALAPQSADRVLSIRAHHSAAILESTAPHLQRECDVGQVDLHLALEVIGKVGASGIQRGLR